MILDLSSLQHRCRCVRFYFVTGAIIAVIVGEVLPLCLGAPADEVTVVDIIPESLSGETHLNTEPNIAVNPANPLQIAASAYMPEPLGGKTSAIFISADGGRTWSCRSRSWRVTLLCDLADR